MKKLLSQWIAFLVLMAAAGMTTAARAQVIQLGAVWLDNRGQQIQAHGGGILHWHGKYY